MYVDMYMNYVDMEVYVLRSQETISMNVMRNVGMNSFSLDL